MDMTKIMTSMYKYPMNHSYDFTGGCPPSTILKGHLFLVATFKIKGGGHGGRVVTLSPPTSEAGVRFLARPQVGKLVVACHWSAVYSTEP